MQIYIFKDGRQSGPFDESAVLEQLRTGIFSPDDLAIRQGDRDWSKLADIFAGRIAAEPVSVTTPKPVPAQQRLAGSAGIAETRGCRKILGWLMLLFGLLLFLGGAAGAAANRVFPPGTCEIADQYQAEADRAVKDADAARGTPKQVELEAKAKEKIESARIWTRGCAESMSVHNMFLAALIGSSVIGFLIFTTGYFVRRVRSV